MEKEQLTNIYIPINIYYKFIHCVFIKSTGDVSKFQCEFNNFCEKYKIIKKEEIYSLLENIKQHDQTYKNCPLTNEYIIGNALLFVIYYLKNNNKIFYYLNMMLLLMKATCNSKFTVETAGVEDDDESDRLIEKTIDNLERIDTLINFTNDIQKIAQKINDTAIYEIETTITKTNCLHMIISRTNPLPLSTSKLF